MKSQRILLLLGIFVTGCVTDKLLVYEQQLLSAKEWEGLLGSYETIEMLEDLQLNAITFTASKQGAGYLFRGEATNKEGKKEAYDFDMLLSKIPNSKSQLLLLSTPELRVRGRDKPTKNFFAICKFEGRKLFVWFLYDKQAPVLAGKVAVVNGQFNSEELREFLEDHADAYVSANRPAYTFRKKMRF